MNNKGQALVEFVLTLPLFLLILFVLVDFGLIFNAKSKLENTSMDIVTLLKEGSDVDTVRKLYPSVDIELITDSNYITVKIDDKVDLITPVLNRVLPDPYNISVERVILNA